MKSYYNLQRLKSMMTTPKRTKSMEKRENFVRNDVNDKSKRREIYDYASKHHNFEAKVDDTE